MESSKDFKRTQDGNQIRMMKEMQQVHAVENASMKGLSILSQSHSATCLKPYEESAQPSDVMHIHSQMLCML